MALDHQLTAEQAAREIGCTSGTIKRHILAGRLKARKDMLPGRGGLWLINREDLLAFRQSLIVDGPAK